MCHGGINLKHLQRETESRLAGWPQRDVAMQPRPGVFARLRTAVLAIGRLARADAQKTAPE